MIFSGTVPGGDLYKNRTLDTPKGVFTARGFYIQNSTYLNWNTLDVLAHMLGVSPAHYVVANEGFLRGPSKKWTNYWIIISLLVRGGYPQPICVWIILSDFQAFCLSTIHSWVKQIFSPRQKPRHVNFPLPRHQPSYSQLMSKGCPITETKRIVLGFP